MRTILGLIALLACVSSQAALLSRAGGQAYYDDMLDVTWLTDANYAETSGYDADGVLTWDEAHAFAAWLNSNAHLGVTNWRLPKVTPINGVSFNLINNPAPNDGSADFGYNITAPGSVYAGSTATELPYMFYNNLGNNAFFAVDGSFNTVFGLQNAGPFVNLLNTLYWTGTEIPGDPTQAFYFSMSTGGQNDLPKTNVRRVWVLADGDVLAVVPLPAGAWLLVSALASLGWLRRVRGE